MEPFKPFASHLIPLPNENVDTDQIIPARYLKGEPEGGYGSVLFHDWRFDAEGKPRADFALNKPEHQNATILLAGDNFGCGSSREHAPWALVGFGFKAIISTSFADIFRNNALKNGLLPIIVDEETHQQLFSLAAEDPAVTVAIDLESATMTLPDGRKVPFPIDTFFQECLVKGLDQMGYLFEKMPTIEAYEADHPPPVLTDR